jgi:hypothetical protein
MVCAKLAGKRSMRGEGKEGLKGPNKPQHPPKFLPSTLASPRRPSSTMPRATSDRFIRAHQPSAKKAGSSSKSSGADTASSSSTATHNPIFNTERFGQHILKNPLVAQGCVCPRSCLAWVAELMGSVL